MYGNRLMLLWSQHAFLCPAKHPLLPRSWLRDVRDAPVYWIYVLYDWLKHPGSCQRCESNLRCRFKRGECDLRDLRLPYRRVTWLRLGGLTPTLHRKFQANLFQLNPHIMNHPKAWVSTLGSWEEAQSITKHAVVIMWALQIPLALIGPCYPDDLFTPQN